MALPVPVPADDLMPTPHQVSRRVQALTQVIPGEPVSMRHEADGTVSVRLPAAAAEFFIADLARRAQDWKQSLRKAQLQESARQAKIRADLAAQSHHLEAEEIRLALGYAKLRAEGLGHLAAIRWLAGSQTTPAPGGGCIAEDIARGLPRLRRQKRIELAAQVRAAVTAGESLVDVARRLELTQSQVYSLVRLTEHVRALPTADRLPDYPELLPRGSRRGDRTEREAREREILSLAMFEGLTVRAIADKLGVSYLTVRAVVRRAGVTPPDARHCTAGQILGKRAAK